MLVHVVWCGVVWCGVVWCGVVWCGVVWCGVVWCGVVWCGVVWCGVVWCGVVWCGVVWCGVVWCSFTIKFYLHAMCNQHYELFSNCITSYFKMNKLCIIYMILCIQFIWVRSVQVQLNINTVTTHNRIY